MSIELDRKAIEAILPHRDPFLWVDRMLEVEPGVSGTGELDISPDWPLFQGHFPGEPVFPGVLVLEALAQVGGVVILSMPENKGRLAFLGGVENAKFRRMVKPGDTLRMHIEITRLGSRAGKGKVLATVQEERACEAEIFFVLGDPK